MTLRRICLLRCELSAISEVNCTGMNTAVSCQIGVAMVPRLLDVNEALCTPCRDELPADTTLKTLFSYVDQHRTDGSRPYLLRTPFPYRQLDSRQHHLTLQVSHHAYSP